MVRGLVKLCLGSSIILSHSSTSDVRYQQFLASKSRKFKLHAWLQYDTQFRLRLSLNKSLSFDTVDSELWGTCFTADSLLQRQSCLDGIAFNSHHAPFEENPAAAFIVNHKAHMDNKGAVGGPSLTPTGSISSGEGFKHALEPSQKQVV